MTPISTWPSHPLPHPSFWSFPHLGPGSCPPLCGAGQAAAGPAGLGALPGAVLGVQGAVGAVLQALHALHRPRLHPQLPAGAAAGAPLLSHPPARAGRWTWRRHWRRCLRWETAGNAPNATPNPHVRGMGAPQAAQRGLTWAGSIPGGCSASGSALASCRCHRSSCAPSGCRFSDGSRTWCTGCLRGQSVGGEVLGVGVPPGCPRSHSCIPAGIFALRCHPRFAEDTRVSAGPSPRTRVPQAAVDCTQLIEDVPAYDRGLEQVTFKGSF